MAYCSHSANVSDRMNAGRMSFRIHNFAYEHKGDNYLFVLPNYYCIGVKRI